MFLKSVSRLEAFLVLNYIAITVHAVIERQLRMAMAAQEIKTLAESDFRKGFRGRS